MIQPSMDRKTLKTLINSVDSNEIGYDLYIQKVCYMGLKKIVKLFVTRPNVDPSTHNNMAIRLAKKGKYNGIVGVLKWNKKIITRYVEDKNNIPSQKTINEFNDRLEYYEFYSLKCTGKYFENEFNLISKMTWSIKNIEGLIPDVCTKIIRKLFY